MASQHLWAFFNPQEAPPPYAEVPEGVDAAAKDRMLLLARYAMQNGASFVDMVRAKQAGNPEYDFLNVPGSSSYGFFRWALFAAGCGLPVEQPPPEGFVPPAPQLQQQQQQPPQQQQQYGAPVQPAPSPQQQMMYAQQPQLQPGYPGQPYMQPPPQHYQQQQQQPLRPTPPPIPPEVAGGFSQVLDALTGSKDSIKASQGWFMACAPYAAGMAYMMASRASTTAEFDKLLHLVYLANDILFKAFTAAQQPHQQQPTADGQQQQQQGAADAQASWASIRAAFAPALGVLLAAAQAAAASSSNGAGREKLSKMLTFWQEKGLFDAGLMARVQQEMATADPANALLRSYPPAAAAALPDQQQQQQQQQPQAPISGGWGAPPAAAAAAYPPPAGWPPAAPAAGSWGAPHQQPPGVPPGWPAVQPGVPPNMPSPWGYPGQPGGPVPPVYPGAVPPGMPYPGGVPPGGYQPQAVTPGAVAPPHAPPGEQRGMPPASAPSPGTNPAIAMAAAAAAAAAAAMREQSGQQQHQHHHHHQQQQQQQQPPEPEIEPVSSFNFPPGLIPQLVRDKSKWSEPYAAIDPIEVEKAGLPPPPEKDAYLKSRLEKFMLELRDYKPGSCRADLEEARAAARAQQGLEPDSDEVRRHSCADSSCNCRCRRACAWFGCAVHKHRNPQRQWAPSPNSSTAACRCMGA
ncbi:hypothetical protein COO60DRAFT_644316 [Scenedesmus sp. NREL 46B-D3]|nr:hypothetical protein COO60DRAFT_644316 [Scenedesmus sp. NREL 46B-D3]